MKMAPHPDRFARHGRGCRRRARLPLALITLLLGIGASARSVAAGPEPGAAAPEPAPPVVRFVLDEASGRPGEVVALRLSVITEAKLQSLSIALNFDARTLRAENVLRLVESAPPQPPAGDTFEVRINNQNEGLAPADAALNGWIHLELAVVEDDAVAVMENTAEAIFEIRFLVLRGNQENPAAPFFAPVVFEDVGRDPDVPDAPFRNRVDFLNENDEVVARVLAGDDLDDGGVVILGIGEIGFFRRADSNHDCTIDISDSLFTLGSLFLSGGPPPCADAADANDDGQMDISDAVFTLSWLFTGGSAPPYPLDFGLDPTEDDLACDLHYEEPCPGADPLADS